MGLSPISIPSMTSVPALVLMLVFILSGAVITDAYANTRAFCPAASLLSSARRSSAGTPLHGIHKPREAASPVTLYLFPTPPSILAANYPQNPQCPLQDAAARGRCRDPRRDGPPATTTRLPMSSAVLAESDVLPAFRAAHGLLSPEVVSLIADANDLELDGPLYKFLKTYKRQGPMACLPLLSDPCVLPALTRAMREIA